VYTLQNKIGRLIELRVESPMEIHDLHNFPVEATRAVSKHSKVVVVTDLLGARVFTQNVADEIIHLIQHDGPRVERNAFLVGESAVFSMQIERIIRESAAPGRRAFRTVPTLESWCKDVLSPAEMSRVVEFLNEGVISRRRQTHH
jgi:hypothetical protein